MREMFSCTFLSLDYFVGHRRMFLLSFAATALFVGEKKNNVLV